MSHVFTVLAVVAAGVYLVARALRSLRSGGAIDVGAVSDGWIAEHRREEPR